MNFEATKRQILFDRLPVFGLYFKRFFSKTKNKELNLGGTKNLIKFLDSGKIGEDKYYLRQIDQGNFGNVEYTILVKLDIEIRI